MIEGHKVSVRKLTASDPFAEAWISKDCANFIPCPEPLSRYYETYPNSGTGWLGIVENESKLLVGRAGLLARSDIFNPAELEIAYVVDPEQQRKGFAREEAKLLLTYAQESPRISRVFLGIAPENGASIGIAESLGLKREYSRLHFNMLHEFYWYRKSGTFEPEQFTS